MNFAIYIFVFLFIVYFYNTINNYSIIVALKKCFEDKIGCSVRVTKSCSTYDTRRVTAKRHEHYMIWTPLYVNIINKNNIHKTWTFNYNTNEDQDKQNIVLRGNRNRSGHHDTELKRDWRHVIWQHVLWRFLTRSLRHGSCEINVTWLNQIQISSFENTIWNKLEVHVLIGEDCYPINWFCLSQPRTWISNVTCRCLFVLSEKMRADCSFC